MTAPVWKANASTLIWAPQVALSIGYPTSGDLVTNTPPTHVGGKWVQDTILEIKAVIEGAGLVFNPADTTQLLAAIRILLSE